MGGGLERFSFGASGGRGGEGAGVGRGPAGGADRVHPAAGESRRRRSSEQSVHGLPGHGHVQGHADASPGGRDRALRELWPNPGARLTTLRLRADGGARGNPGPAALGVVIEDDQGMRLLTVHRFLGVASNNQAEDQALIEGLKAVADWEPDRLEVYLDSKPVVGQVDGKWKGKEPQRE